MKDDVKARLIARAWKDQAFKKLLLENPNSALSQMGVQVPAGVKLHVVQETSDNIYLVLPSDEISDQDLDNVAGGFTPIQY